MEMCPQSTPDHDEITLSYGADHNLPERAAEMVRAVFWRESTGVRKEIDHAIGSGIKVLVYMPDNEKPYKKAHLMIVLRL